MSNDLLALALDALKEGRQAIGDHWSPNDCYATGPLTGDAVRDLIECPACSFIAKYDAAIAAFEAAPSLPVDEKVQELGSVYDCDDRMDEVRPLRPPSVELPVVAWRKQWGHGFRCEPFQSADTDEALVLLSDAQAAILTQGEKK